MERLRLKEQGLSARQADEFLLKKEEHDFNRQKARFQAGLSKDVTGTTIYDPYLTDAFDVLGSNQQSNNRTGISIPQDIYDSIITDQSDQTVPVKLQDIPVDNVKEVNKKKRKSKFLLDKI